MLLQHLFNLSAFLFFSFCACGCAANGKHFCHSGDFSESKNECCTDHIGGGETDKQTLENEAICQLYRQAGPKSGVLYHLNSIFTASVSICLLTCLGIRCRHIDEVQSTWRSCRGKGCLELWAS